MTRSWLTRAWNPFPVVLAAWLVVNPVRAAAQDTVQAIPASLLRRLAEVTDGQSFAGKVYIVARYAFPHDVIGVFQDRARAEAVVRRGVGLGLFGPYESTLSLPPRKYAVGGCVHDGNKSMYEICPQRVVDLPAVRGVKLVTFLQNGDSIVGPLLGPNIDAIFFTLDAMDKFAFPYYTRLVGVQETARMRDELLARIRAPQ